MDEKFNGSLKYVIAVVVVAIGGLGLVLLMAMYSPKEHTALLVTGTTVFLGTIIVPMLGLLKATAELADHAKAAAAKADSAAVTSEKTYHLVNGNMTQFKELMDIYLETKTKETYAEGQTVGELIGAAPDEASKQALRLAASIPAPSKQSSMPKPLEHPPEPPKP